MSRKPMNTIVKIDIKNIMIDMKKGYTWADYEAKYGYSKDEIMYEISRCYSKNAKKRQEILGGIEANSKVKRKKPVVEVREEAKKEKPDEATVASESPEAAAETTAGNLPCTLEELLEKEARLSAIVIELEKEQKDFVTQHRGGMKKVRALATEIDKLEEKFSACIDKYKDVMAEIRNIEDLIERVSASRRDAKDELSRIRDEIEKFTHVVVFVYDNGSIEVQEGSLTLDDHGHEDLYKELRDDERCENLRIIDIKTLAKAICIKSNSAASAPNIKVEFLFDNEEVERLFDQLG